MRIENRYTVLAETTYGDLIFDALAGLVFVATPCCSAPAIETAHGQICDSCFLTTDTDPIHSQMVALSDRHAIRALAVRAGLDDVDIHHVMDYLPIPLLRV